MSAREKFSSFLYISGLLMLVAGLPVSLFLTSLSQFFIIGSIVFSPAIAAKIRRFWSNKAAVLIAGIWLMHLIGMLWTSDTAEGLKDLRIKLPLLLLPVAIAGNDPLNSRQLRMILFTFAGAVFCGTMVSMAVLAGIIHRNIYDIRDVFIFNISHIRFALFTCLSVFILFYYAFLDRSLKPSLSLKVLSLLFMTWFLVFLIIVVSMTGLLIFGLTSFVLISAYIIRGKRQVIKFSLLTAFLAITAFAVFELMQIVDSVKARRNYADANGTVKTREGNNYDTDTFDKVYENGYPVWMFVCEKELRQTWNSLSEYKYDSLDERKQPVRATLVRFMTSKGMKKDAEGVRQLSADERRAIERGVANVNYQKISSFRSRVQQIVWEVDQFFRYGNASGHSVTQRFEFWHAGLLIAGANIWTGVGTGDMPRAYQREYDLMNSPLDAEHRLRAHNQFLAITVAFGLFGLVFFLLALFYPLLFVKMTGQMLFYSFWLIAFFSMFSEDTLETQAGATFVAFFFVLLMKEKDNVNNT